MLRPGRPTGGRSLYDVRIVALPHPRALVSPVLVGRRPQLDALEHALEQASGGRGGAVLLYGDAGIGKSRLIAEASARAAASGFRVLTGQAFERDELLAPVIDLYSNLEKFIDKTAARISIEASQARTVRVETPHSMTT